MDVVQQQNPRAPRWPDCPVLPQFDLRQRLGVLVLVRYIVVLAVVAGVFMARPVLGIVDLDRVALFKLAAALFLYNTATWIAIKVVCRPHVPSARTTTFLERVLHGSVATDFIGLTVALWLVGGPLSPFSAFFIFNVIVASMLLSTPAAFFHAILAYALYSGLVLGIWFGWIPAHYPEGAVAPGAALNGTYVITIVAVQGLLIMLTALLTTYLMQMLRQRSARLATANDALASVSQLRRDFLQIALHNLRSPVSVASMHLSNIANGYGGPLTDDQTTWIERSRHRLEELGKFLHDLEYLAALETDALDDQKAAVDVNDLAADVVAEHQDLANLSGHTLTIKSAPGPAMVVGISRLIREALANYLTNAIKYTPRGGTIVLRVLLEAETVSVTVEDTGIGLSGPDRRRIFREMVRIHRDEAPLGPVGGSGLGLHLVQRIALMHDATVGVDSREGLGSTFQITFKRLVADAGSSER